MLHAFLLSNRLELIQDCKDKVASRFSPGDIPAIIDHGVPLFLAQLIDALKHRPTVCDEDEEAGDCVSFPPEIGQSAAVHGAELLRRGFTVDQVVHDYGDICQAITEMAVKRDAPIDPDDFRILNGCLDNAIAGAVTAFVDGRETEFESHANKQREHLSGASNRHRRLVRIAMQAFVAIKTGSLGLGGATGTLLLHALTELQSLAETPSSDEPPT